MKKQILSLMTFFLMPLFQAESQSSYKENYHVKWYSKGISSFYDNHFVLSKNFFDKIHTEDDRKHPYLERYKIFAIIKSENTDAADDLKKYLETNPFSTNRNKIVILMAEGFFEKNQAEETLNWLEKVNPSLLNNEEEVKYNYMMGFANYIKGDYTLAKKYLMLLSKKNEKKDEIHYYLGNISMEKKDYETALSYFNTIEDSAFLKQIQYKKLVILYKKLHYEEAFTLGKDILEDAEDTSVKSQIAKIVGESLFYQKKYEESIHYLLKYKEQSKKLSELDYYFLGYAYYQISDYEKAIENFNKIIDQKNDVSQNAHYHLGDCYLKLNKKTEAMNAFKHSSEMDFDLNIQQDAFLNYTKLSYEIGNPYTNSSDVLRQFVTNYPNAKETPEIEKLIIDSFLEFKDYKGAIDYYIEKKLIQDYQYQSLLIKKGFQIFNEKNYDEALHFFSTAHKLFIDDKLKQQALFWKAETFYEKNNFSDASYAYASFIKSKDSEGLKEYPDGLYGLAYSLFQQKKYGKSLTFFEKYYDFPKNNDLKKIDAKLRIADCFYVGKDYHKALSNYQKTIEKKSPQEDYALYQKALCLGFLGHHEKKEKTLKDLQDHFLNSPYLDKSYYELGNLYTNNNEKIKAINVYNDLIHKYPKSSLVPKAKLKTAIIFFNDNNLDGSLNLIKKLVNEYPGTAEAVQGVKTAEQIYKEMGDIDSYKAWLTQLEFINISDSKIEKMMFEVAEHKYFSNELKETIANCKKYLINFPNGIYALTVHFYLGESYFKYKDFKKAITEYLEILKINTNEYTEVSLNKLSQIYLEQQRWDLASELLLRIEKESTNGQSKIYAQSNLMKFYYRKQDYEKTLDYTYLVLTNVKTSEDILTDAYIYGARSAFNLEKYNEARKYYKKLEHIGNGKIKAESHYHKAFWLHQEKNYSKSNAQIQLLSSRFQNYKYWGTKGLVLMAKNFHELDDDFQATFILNTILKNATEFDDITKETEELLKQYRVDEISEEKKDTEKDPDLG